MEKKKKKVRSEQPFIPVLYDEHCTHDADVRSVSLCADLPTSVVCPHEAARREERKKNSATGSPIFQNLGCVH
jgi:hypothetical protein